MMRVILVLLLAGGLAAAARAQIDDEPVEILKQQQGTEVRLIAEPRHLTDATLVLTADLVNMDASPRLPLTAEIRTGQPVLLCVLKATDPRSPWHYYYHFKWKYGLKGGAADRNAVYLLPYNPTHNFTVMQGYRGSFSHQKGSINEFAYDFEMPVGTPVCAARGGIVIGVRQDSDAGGASPEFKLSANYVMIRHSDGTYAEYLHLRKGGVTVNLGQTVVVGQPIGFSGVTGFTSGPHVHFAVFHIIDKESGPERESLPIRIRTKEGIYGELVQGRSY